MLDATEVTEQLRTVLHDSPNVRLLLEKVARRLEKSGRFKGQLKLGENLPAAVREALLQVFPNRAVQVRPNGDVVLKLDHVVIEEEDEPVLLKAYATVFGFDGEAEERRERVKRDTRKMLDRFRLAYPDLEPVWDDCLANLSEWIAMARKKGGESVREELTSLSKAVRFLQSPHDPLGRMELGARFFNDSKAFKQSPSRTARMEQWLLLMENREITEENRRQVWADHDVVDNPTAIKVSLFGPLLYTKQGREWDWIARLHEQGESATLSWDNLQGIESLKLPKDIPVITCENETPFNTLIREKQPGLIIYTAGYPNSAVRKLIAGLPNSVSSILHWGDSDLDGLRIASIIHRIRPVTLWRCGLEELRRHQAVLHPLTVEQQQRIEHFLQVHPDYPFRAELQYTLGNGWLEQEQYIPIV